MFTFFLNFLRFYAIIYVPRCRLCKVLWDAPEKVLGLLNPRHVRVGMSCCHECNKNVLWTCPGTNASPLYTRRPISSFGASSNAPGPTKHWTASQTLAGQYGYEICQHYSIQLSFAEDVAAAVFRQIGGVEVFRNGIKQWKGESGSNHT